MLRPGFKRRSVLLAIAYFWVSVVPALPQNKPASPESALDAVIANAKANGDKKAEKRATNLRTALTRLKPSELSGISCGKDVAPNRVRVDEGKDIIGDLLGKGLEKYLPTLAAALASAPTAGLATLLTPEKIGPDSVEILNNSTNFTRNDVSNSARQMLQDTIPANFNKLPNAMLAKIVVCSL